MSKVILRGLHSGPEKLTVWFVSGVAALAMTLAPKEAKGAGLYQVVLADCASQISSIPVDVVFPAHRTSAIVHPRFDGGSANETCSDFTWVKVQGKVTSVSIDWRGRTTALARDCFHSTMSWGLYKKGSGGAFSLIGGGSSYGNMPGGDGNTCLYNMSLSSVDWGSFSATTGTSASAEYRVAFHLWSHDDPDISHFADDCADPENCYWPIQLTLGGTPGTPPLQDYATAERINSGGQATWTWYWVDNPSFATNSWIWGDSSGGGYLIPGDYDGDGLSDHAWSVYATQTRRVGINLTTGGQKLFNFATGADVPIVGADYNGDGRMDVASYLSSSSKFSVRFGNISSRFGTITFNATYPSTVNSQNRAVAGNYDGDLRTDFATWNASTGWRIRESFSGAEKTAWWGVSGDIPIAGDFDGDARTDIAVYRQSEGRFYWISSSTGQGTYAWWGQNGDIPVPAYFDSDTKTDFAIFRPSEARYWVINSSTGSGMWVASGRPFVQPVYPFSQ